MSRLYVLLVGFLMFIIAGLPLASTVAYAQPTIKLGNLVDLTGPTSDQGKDIAQGGIDYSSQIRIFLNYVKETWTETTRKPRVAFIYADNAYGGRRSRQGAITPKRSASTWWMRRSSLPSSPMPPRSC